MIEKSNMQFIRYFKLASIFTFIFSYNILARAEVPLNIPLDAGKLERSFEDRSFEPKTKHQDVQILNIKRKKPKDAENIKFILRKIVIKGNLTYTQKELSKEYSSLIKQEISLAQIYDLTDKITLFYQQKGYVLCKTILPVQSITEGVVTIEVIEGYISKISYNKDFKPSNKIKKIANEIMALRPLNIKELEKQLLLIKDLGGYFVKSTIKAINDTNSSHDGASELILTIERKKNKVISNFDNSGSKYVSQYNIGASYSINNLIAPHHETILGFKAAPNLKDLRAYNISHELPLNTIGSKLNVNMVGITSKIGKNLKPLKIASSFNEGSIKLIQAVVKQRDQDLSFNIKLARKRNLLTTFSQKLSDNIYNVASIGGRYDFADKYDGANLVELNFTKLLKTNKNITAFSRNANYQYLKATRVQYINNSFDVVVSGTAQRSRSILPATEQLYYGSLSYNNSYDQTNVFGDYGAISSFEIRSKNLFNDIKILNGSNLFASIDYGKLFSNSGIKSKKASTLSIGLRGDLPRSIKYNLILYKGLTQQNSQKNKGLGFNITKSF
jgi:hemolysin activation/secretion protein